MQLTRFAPINVWIRRFKECVL